MVGSHTIDGSVDFVEISWGPAAVNGAARDSDIAAVPAVVHGEVSYGVLRDLSVPEDIGAVEHASAFGVEFGVLSSRGKDFPGGVSPPGHHSRSPRGEAGESLCGSSFRQVFLGVEGVEEFGTVPLGSRVDSCQYDEGPNCKPHKGSQYWLSDFDLGDLGFCCQKLDVLGRHCHKRCSDSSCFPGKKQLEVQFFSCLRGHGLRVV